MLPLDSGVFAASSLQRTGIRGTCGILVLLYIHRVASYIARHKPVIKLDVPFQSFSFIGSLEPSLVTLSFHV